MNAFQEAALHSAIEAAWGAIELGQWHNAEMYANQAVGTVNALWWDSAIGQEEWLQLRAILNNWAIQSWFQQRGFGTLTYDGANTHV